MNFVYSGLTLETVATAFRQLVGVTVCQIYEEAANFEFRFGFQSGTLILLGFHKDCYEENKTSSGLLGPLRKSQEAPRTLYFPSRILFKSYYYPRKS